MSLALTLLGCAYDVDDDAAGADAAAVDDGAVDDEGALAAAGFTPDPAGARAVLLDVVIPNFESASGTVRNEGDNLARMSVVRRSLQVAVDLLSLPVPDTVRAASMLRNPTIPMLETAPGYLWVKRNNPNAFASTKIGKARAGIDSAITKLTGATAPTTRVWTTYPADTARARARIVDVALPELTASTGFTNDTGDNRKRMSIVKRSLEIARDILSLPAPDPGRARAALHGVARPILVSAPGYRRILEANPNAFPTTKMGKAKRALDFSIDKSTASPAIFMEPGVFIVNGAQWAPAAKGALLRDHGYGWVSIKIHHGPAREGEQYLQQGLVDGYHAYGIQVGGWGYLTEDPETDANVAADMIEQYGLDFYLADAEAEYKYTSQSGAPDAVAYGRSRRFVEAFRARLPGYPAAVSTFGAASHVERLVDIDWAPWKERGFDLMQQVYWNDYDIYRPSRCVRAALADGWPIQRIHPTLGIWGGGVTRVVSVTEYLDDLSGTDVYGVNTFIGDQMSDEDTRALGVGLLDRGLAR